MAKKLHDFSSSLRREHLAGGDTPGHYAYAMALRVEDVLEKFLVKCGGSPKLGILVYFLKELSGLMWFSEDVCFRTLGGMQNLWGCHQSNCETWVLDSWMVASAFSIVENTLDLHVLEFEQYQKWRLNGGPTNYGGCVGLPLGSVSWQRTVQCPLKLWLVVWNI